MPNFSVTIVIMSENEKLVTPTIDDTNTATNINNVKAIRLKYFVRFLFVFIIRFRYVSKNVFQIKYLKANVCSRKRIAICFAYLH